MREFGSWTELQTLVFRSDGFAITLQPNGPTTYTADRVFSLPPGDTTQILVSEDATQTLTNKSISGSANTLTNIPLGSVTGVLAQANGGTGQNSTAIFPTSGVVVTEAATETLTNKSMSGASNTFTAIPANTALSNQVPIANGGTGQATATAAFDALSPTTAKGDLIVRTSTSNVAQAVGSDGTFLTADSAQTSGVSWTNPSGLLTSILDRKNYALNASVAASAMTIALKIADGTTNASTGNPISIGMRSSTASSGAYNPRSVTGALSITIPSGATLGFNNNASAPIYVYAIDNSGTVELAVSYALFSTISSGQIGETLVTTTTISSGATSRSVMYSTTGRTTVPFRLLGMVFAPQSSSGTWASGPTLVTSSIGASYASSDLPGLVYTSNSEIWAQGGNGYGSTNNKIRRFSNTQINSGSGITYADSPTLGGSFTINERGIYSITYWDARAAGQCAIGISLNTTAPTTVIQNIGFGERVGFSGTVAATDFHDCNTVLTLVAGDVIRAHTDGNADGGTSTAFRIIQLTKFQI